MDQRLRPGLLISPDVVVHRHDVLSHRDWGNLREHNGTTNSVSQCRVFIALLWTTLPVDCAHPPRAIPRGTGNTPEPPAIKPSNAYDDLGHYRNTNGDLDGVEGTRSINRLRDEADRRAFWTRSDHGHCRRSTTAATTLVLRHVAWPVIYMLAIAAWQRLSTGRADGSLEA